MSSTTFPLSDIPPHNPWSVSFRLLFGLYAIIPICITIYVIDLLFWDHYLQSVLPSSPSHYLLFQILFGTPHIIASNLMLISHADYFKYYKNKLIVMTALIFLVFGIGSLYIPYKTLYVMTACWTVYHVFKQQHGIGKAICKLPTWAFYWILWLSVITGIFIYLGIFLKNSWTTQQSDWIQLIAVTLTIGLILSTVLCQRYVKTSLGKSFLWANTLLIVSSCYLYSQQYYFMAILVPRLVHDATAYVFYVTHEYNRHAQTPGNALYKLAARCNIYVFIVLPVLSFTLTFVLQAYGDAFVNWLSETLFEIKIRKAITVGLIGYLSLMHYYTEAFVWQAGSPLRKYIRFSH